METLKGKFNSGPRSKQTRLALRKTRSAIDLSRLFEQRHLTGDSRCIHPFYVPKAEHLVLAVSICPKRVYFFAVLVKQLALPWRRMDLLSGQSEKF